MSKIYKDISSGNNPCSEPLLETNQSNKKATLTNHLIFLGIWIINFGLEFIYRQPFFDKSLQLQEKLSTTDAGVAIFNALSVYGDGPPYFVVFVIMFNWFSRGRAFYYICFLSAVPYLTIIPKMIYHQPRPFMVVDKI